MKSNTPDKIKEAFDQLFNSFTEEEKIESEARLIMFRFLDIVERKREELGISRKELANKVGTSASFITQIMRGDKLVNMPTLAKMQRALNIQFEIAEKTSYEQQTKALSPVSDGKGMWYWKPFDQEGPGYGKISNLPKAEPEKKIA